MKTAIYIAEGHMQLVLTPQSKWEKNAIRDIGEEGASLTIKRGSFYECHGGWTRQGPDDESLILRVNKEHPDA